MRFWLIRKIEIYTSIALLCLLTNCKDPAKEELKKFDRSEMLQNIANNLIVPNIETCKTQVEALQSSITAFDNLPDSSNLVKVRNAWILAYTSWQHSNAFNFGPAGEEGLRKSLQEEIATFPSNKLKIETAISSGAYNFNDFNRDNRGFLAIEYLIYGEGKSISQVLSGFEEAKRKTYLKDLISHLNTRLSLVLDTWKGNYKSEFVANNGTDVGSSTSILYNEFVKSFESLKNFKLGLPMGKRPGQTQSEPSLVEAYYSGLSLLFFKEHYQSIKNIWYGTAQNGNEGIGFREYLENVEGGKDLIVATENQLKAIDMSLSKIPAEADLKNLIQSSDEQLSSLYIEVQKHTRFFKSDMSSLLGIAITFSSGDGD
jgi:hypothetical protein